jgi:hypothetical protein
MNFIELLFKLMARFIDMEQGRLGELKLSADRWIAEQKESKGYMSKLVEYQNLWYVQIILCFVFLFMVKSIARWMISDNTRSNDDDDDDIDEDEDDSDEEDYKDYLREKKQKSTKINLNSLKF